MYQDATLQALGALTNLKPGESIPLAEVFDRITLDMGLQFSGTKDRSRAYVAVSKTLAKMRGEGLCTNPRRGVWGLTHEGIRQCNLGSDEAEQNNSPVWTSEDEAYLLSLAEKSVRCLGWYKRTSKFCGDCYLVERCRQHYPVHIQRAARELEEVKQLAGKIADFDPPEKTADIEFEDLLEGLDEEMQKNHPNPELVRRLVAEGHTVQVVPIESVCSVCGEIIPEKSTVIWDSGRGNTHLECWKDLE
jgi:hypothetical protein